MRYKIKPRFFVTLFVIVFIFNLMLHNVSKKYEEPKEVVVYTLSYGDTTWKIAEKHKPDNMDVREYLNIISQYNPEINSLGVLKEGQQLNIPIY